GADPAQKRHYSFEGSCNLGNGQQLLVEFPLGKLMAICHSPAALPVHIDPGGSQGEDQMGGVLQGPAGSQEPLVKQGQQGLPTFGTDLGMGIETTPGSLMGKDLFASILPTLHGPVQEG